MKCVFYWGVKMILVDNNQRVAYLDYARIFACFLVIYGHLYTPDPNNLVRVFIYQFHMPLFFCISGMLHKYDGSIQIKKYIKTILIPTVFFAMIYFFVTGVLYHLGFWNYKEAVPQDLVLGENIFYTYLNYFIYSVKGFVFGSSMLNGPCWFLIALFYCKVFIDVFNRKPVVSSCVWFLLFFILCVYVHKNFFVANFVMAFPFYYVGYKSKNICKKMFANATRRFILLLFSLASILFIMKFNGTVSTWSIVFGHAHFPFNMMCYYAVGVSGMIMVCSIASFMKKSNVYSLFAANSLISVLGFQVLFIFIVDNVIGFNHSYETSFLIALVIYMLCLIGHIVVSRKAPFLIGKVKK